MSQYINYSQYQQMMNGSSPASMSPRMNTGEKWKKLIYQLEELREELTLEQKDNQKLRVTNEALLDAIGRVFSPKLADQLEKIILEGSYQTINADIYQVFTSHQSMLTISDWSDSNKKDPRHITPSKSLHRSPLSPLAINKYHTLRNSFSQSSTTGSKLIATEIMCQICQENFPPVQFLSHAEKCKEKEPNISLIALEDTQDREWNTRRTQYISMMESLQKIKIQIEEQIKMLKSSKQKIDRATEKKKLQKDLAKVIFIIQQKENKLKSLNNSKGSNKLNKSKKNTGIKSRN